MFALTTALISLIGQVSGTPYIPGGDTPAGTDCSGLASWVANVASGRPAFGSRFNTGNMESALLSRGFRYGTAPNSVVIGWNGGHAAVTLPDGTPVSSGESGSGVRVGGGGAYQPQFTNHMYLPIEVSAQEPEESGQDAPVDPTAPTDAPAAPPAPEPHPGEAPAPLPQAEPQPGQVPAADPTAGDLDSQPADAPSGERVEEPTGPAPDAEPGAEPAGEPAAAPAPDSIPPMPVQSI